MISPARNKIMVYIFVPFCWNLFTKCVCSQLVSSPCYNSVWFIFCTKSAVVKNISWYNGHLFIQQQQQQQVGEGNTNRYHGWVSLGTFFDWMNKLLLNTTTCHIEVLEWSMHCVITRWVENSKLLYFLVQCIKLELSTFDIKCYC